MDKYTFLLPAYKATFFEEALGSILGQTYSNFNVIVSDDCSPEDLKSIVDKFNDPRVEYRRNERNIGAEHLVNHWNMLLSMTDAEYIIMASDDDVYNSGYLEEMDRLIRLYPDVNIFRPRIRIIRSDGSELREEWTSIAKERIDRKTIVSLIVSEQFASGIPQFVFKRQALVDEGGFVNLPYAWYSDDATVGTLSESGLGLSSKTLFSFRYSGLSISTNKKESYEVLRGKLYSTAGYMKRVLGWRDVAEDEVLISEVIWKIRKNTISMLNGKPIRTFLRMMFYIRSLKTPLFSFGWRTERYIERIHHKML